MRISTGNIDRLEARLAEVLAGRTVRLQNAIRIRLGGLLILTYVVQYHSDDANYHKSLYGELASEYGIPREVSDELVGIVNEGDFQGIGDLYTTWVQMNLIPSLRDRTHP